MAVWAVCKIAGEGFEWTLATGIAVVILLAAIVIMMAMVMPKFKAMQALTDNINLVARENHQGWCRDLAESRQERCCSDWC